MCLFMAVNYLGIFNNRQLASNVCLGEGKSTPLQYSCLKNPMDGGAWQAVVHGVPKSQTQLGDFTFTFHLHALEKEMATHSSVLAWRIPGMGSLVGCHLWGHAESDTTEATQQQQQCPYIAQTLIFFQMTFSSTFSSNFSIKNYTLQCLQLYFSFPKIVSATWEFFYGTLILGLFF